MIQSYRSLHVTYVYGLFRSYQHVKRFLSARLRSKKSWFRGISPPTWRIIPFSKISKDHPHFKSQKKGHLEGA